MTPSEFYYGPFREQFALFWGSLNARGSVSRVRKGLTPSRFAWQRETHFSVVDLVAAPDRNLPDHLVDVPLAHQIDFLCALLYTILVDQTMYAHRRLDYERFRSLTNYPKMDRTVGYARALCMANPFEILDTEVLDSRGITKAEAEGRFAQWAPFIAEDLRSFFTEQRVGATTWEDIRRSILQDPGATWGAAGASLRAALVACRSL
jgi:hypothetical protein